MIGNALKGYNVAILAYGQTSSGKTFTIRGTEGSPGVIQLTARELSKWVAYLKTPEGIMKSTNPEPGDSLELPNSDGLLSSFDENDELDKSSEEPRMVERKIALAVSGLLKISFLCSFNSNKCPIFSML